VTAVKGDVAVSFCFAAAALASATATPPQGRWCGDVGASVPTRHKRQCLAELCSPSPTPQLSSLSIASLRGPPCVLVSLGDQDEMGAWNEQDSMNKLTLSLPFGALCFEDAHRPSELSCTISLPPLRAGGLCFSSASSTCSKMLWLRSPPSARKKSSVAKTHLNCC